MIDIENYIDNFLEEAKSVYGGRLLYVGLQGSYLRGEAHENSDIDIMVVIDGFCVKDMDLYKDILEKIGNSDKACGFICGRDEITGWTPLETFQLLQTTKDLYGNLSELLPAADRRDEITYVKTSLGNMYHEFCHRYIHADRAKSIQKFRGTCKAFFFLIQNLHYLESGKFIKTKRELKEAVSEEDRNILMMAELPDDYDFDKEFTAVIEWCRKAFCRLNEM